MYSFAKESVGVSIFLVPSFYVPSPCAIFIFLVHRQITQFRALARLNDGIAIGSYLVGGPYYYIFRNPTHSVYTLQSHNKHDSLIPYSVPPPPCSIKIHLFVFPRHLPFIISMHFHPQKTTFPTAYRLPVVTLNLIILLSLFFKLITVITKIISSRKEVKLH